MRYSLTHTLSSSVKRQVVLREDPVAVVGVEDRPVEVGIGPGLDRVPEHRNGPLAHVLRAVLLTFGRPVHGDRDRLDQLAVAALRLALLPLEVGVPDRRGDVPADRCQNGLILVVVANPLVIALDREDAEHTILHAQGDAEPVDGVGADVLDRAPRLQVAPHLAVSA